MKKYIAYISLGLLLSGSLTGCNDFLDREPLDKITPEVFFTSESDLAAYAINLYESAFPTTSGYLRDSPLLTDNHTDNQAGSGTPSRWIPGFKKVAANEGDWKWDDIRKCNYFFDQVMPKYEAGEIVDQGNVKHYIGEMKVLRAFFYYKKLVALGDFPIVTTALPADESTLIEASKRRPRYEVAQFIIDELKDAADNYLKEKSPAGKNRISQDVAHLIRARVALFEATWEKYHKGTAFVPGGAGWKGNPEDIKGFDIDKSIDNFFAAAMESSKFVAEKYYGKLAENTDTKEGMNETLQSLNPYYTMFCDVNMEGYDEVLMWREFKEGMVTHHAQMELCRNGGGSGWTRGMVNSFVMRNGYPIYDSRSGYKKEWEKEGVEKTLEGRDSRIVIFTNKPGDIGYYGADGTPSYTKIDYIFGSPDEQRAITGFIVKKGKHYSDIMANQGGRSVSGSVIFRSAEALLIYMEASYEKLGKVDELADKYWRALRQRAKVEENYMITVNATRMDEEAKYDFGAYSHGQLINPTLYNIRRERRNELCAEAQRWDDLKRWRACDQLVDTPYRVQGILLWGSKYETELKDKIKVDPKEGTVSSPELGDYLAVYERTTVNNLIANQGGFKFTPAHYLEPIGMAAFRQTAVDKDDFETSVIYQNPGWGVQADTGAEMVN